MIALGVLALGLGISQMLTLRLLAERLCSRPGSAQRVVLLTALPRLLAGLMLAAVLVWLGPIAALWAVAAASVGRTATLLLSIRR